MTYDTIETSPAAGPSTSHVLTGKTRRAAEDDWVEVVTDRRNGIGVYLTPCLVPLWI